MAETMSIQKTNMNEQIKVVLRPLIKKISMLEQKMSVLEQAHFRLVTEDILIKEWDNKHDARWDAV